MPVRETWSAPKPMAIQLQQALSNCGALPISPQSHCTTLWLSMIISNGLEGGRGVSSTALNDDKCQYIRHFNCGKRAFSDLLSRLSLHTDSNGRNGTISPLLCYSHLASLTSTVEWRRIPDSIGLAPTRFLARWIDAGSDVPCKSVEVMNCRAGRFSLHFISAAIHAILSASQRS